MSLITVEYITDNFEQWEVFCTVEGSDFSAEEILDMKLDLAEKELLEYVEVTEATITEPLTRHLLIIVKKNCFDIQHGDTELENKPQILRDYEATIKALEKYRSGELPMSPEPGENTPTVSITAKERYFDDWFWQGY